MNAFQDKVNYLIQNNYNFKLGDYMNKGIEIFKKNPGGFILYALVYMTLVGIASMIPFASLIVTAPLTAGFYMVAKKIDKGEHYEFGDFFKGFDYIGQLILVGLVGGILMVMGFCLVIPGIYLAIAYTFAPLFVIYGKFEFWDALENSRKVAHQQWFSLFGLAIVLGFINMIGMLVLCVGLFVTIPITYCVFYAAFDDIVGVNAGQEEDDDFRLGDEFSEILDV